VQVVLAVVVDVVAVVDVVVEAVAVVDEKVAKVLGVVVVIVVDEAPQKLFQKKTVTFKPETLSLSLQTYKPSYRRHTHLVNVHQFCCCGCCGKDRAKCH
jgi:hypothetical protein